MPGASVPMLQVICCPFALQPGAETSETPVGSVSVMDTFCALVVVLVFVNPRVYVRVLPRFACAVLTFFVNTMSAFGDGQERGVVIVELLFAVTGSGCTEPTEAAFVTPAVQSCGCVCAMLFGTCTIM